MYAQAKIARRTDGTVATEHHARLSRTHRSQVVAEGVRSVIRAAIRGLSGQSHGEVNTDLHGTAHGATR